MNVDRKRIRVVGTKQVLRALEAGTLGVVYVAADAERSIRERIEAACALHGGKAMLNSVNGKAESMRAVGAACGLVVGAACAGAADPTDRR